MAFADFNYSVAFSATHHNTIRDCESVCSAIFEFMEFYTERLWDEWWERFNHHQYPIDTGYHNDIVNPNEIIDNIIDLSDYDDTIKNDSHFITDFLIMLNDWQRDLFREWEASLPENKRIEYLHNKFEGNKDEGDNE